MNKNEIKLEKNESLGTFFALPFNIMVKPLITYEKVEDKKFHVSLFFMLFWGLITSITSALLAIYLGVDYGNPSNCGGSAQIFADWVVFKVWNIENPHIGIIAFVLANEFGYFFLGVLSTLVIALLAKVPRSEKFQKLINASMAAISYGMTPALLIGWLPNPIFLVGILALIYQSLAIWKIFKLSKKGAVFVALSWILILAIMHDIAVFIVILIIS
jgi:hypothetical protein